MSRLLENSTPAERARKCTFAERFDGATNLAKNGGVISGSATWVSNGLQFNTTSTYVQYFNRNGILNSTWPVWSGVIEFTPNFAANDGVQHSFAASTNYHTYHSSGNDIRISCNGVFAIICTLAEYTSYWVTGVVNRIAWSCASGANYLYLNGTLIKSSNTAWTAASNTNLFFGNSSSNGFTGIMHSAKLFLPSSAAQALTSKDCEVLSAGTTYTYWDSATCIMDGLAANYDIANYRHLDLSGRGNHVLLGDGAGSGTPTKLTAQGYSFNGTTQYMTIPLAAWPGTNGTILFDVSIDPTESASTMRIQGSGHTSGSTYELTTLSIAGPPDQIRFVYPNSGTSRSIYGSYDVRASKYIVGVAHAYSGSTTTLRSYWNGAPYVTQTPFAGSVNAPDTSWWLMRYNTDYTIGTIRSFMAFSKELSSIQVADATLWMRNLRNKV